MTEAEFQKKIALVGTIKGRDGCVKQTADAKPFDARCLRLPAPFDRIRATNWHFSQGAPCEFSPTTRSTLVAFSLSRLLPRQFSAWFGSLRRRYRPLRQRNPRTQPPLLTSRLRRTGQLRTN